jgi:hypothetical protein
MAPFPPQWGVDAMRMLDIDVPEFFVTHIGKVERVGAGCIRLTLCVMRNDMLEPRYSCIWPIDCLLSRHDLVALIGKDVLGEQTAH